MNKNRMLGMMARYVRQLKRALDHAHSFGIPNTGSPNVVIEMAQAQGKASLIMDLLYGYRLEYFKKVREEFKVMYPDKDFDKAEQVERDQAASVADEKYKDLTQLHAIEVDLHDNYPLVFRYGQDGVRIQDMGSLLEQSKDFEKKYLGHIL